MTSIVLRAARPGPLLGGLALSRSEAMPRYDDQEPCGGEGIIDFALCLVVAAAVVGLLLLAL